MAGRNIRISREADYILDNLKLQVRKKYHKTIYKQDIVNWFIQECLTLKQAQGKFFKWVKEK